MSLIRKLSKKRVPLIIAAVGVIGILVAYFFYLLKQVEVAFDSPSEFIPTRIYSKVTRIAPPMPRGYIEKKLRALGYTTAIQGNDMSFTLHSPTYPDYLLPPEHQTLQLKDKKITLHFEGLEPTSGLETVDSEIGSVNDFYLEPEFIATLNSDNDSGEGSPIREVLKFEEFPPTIPDAIIAAEDHHFYEHHGIDPRGFARAILMDIKTLSLSQGGSTITQQLVKNLMKRRNRNIFMKINELFLAPVLEFKYTKKQIFERYLNEVFLGQIGPLEIRGFSEGAKYFFGKKPGDLNMGEIAMLVGLIKGPAFYSPYKHLDRAKTRQRYVLERMLEIQKITEPQFQEALTQPIRLANAPQAGNRAPYFVDYVKAELIKLLSDTFEEKEVPELGFQVFTTLDLDLNQNAQSDLQTGLIALEKRLKIEGLVELQGAVAAVDQSTGEIRSLIGGRNYAQSNFNRILNMKRQVGSTFKPIVYATAFRVFEDPEGNAFTPAYPLLDEQWAWAYDKSQPEWKPQNYEKEKLGWITLKTALAKSINTAAARVAKRIGLKQIAETASQVGIETQLPLVPSMTLGSVELSPMEVLDAYMTFANHGKADQPFVIKAIQNPDGSEFYRTEYRPRNRIDPGIADMMTNLMQAVFAEGGTASFGAALGFDRPAAGKTGTTNDYRDSWFVGYTPQLTTLVWVGLDQGLIQEALKKDPKAPKKIHLTGAVAAFPIWIQIMNHALQYEPAMPFAESEHLVDMRLDLHSGQKAEGSCPESQVTTEKVIVGREPKKSTCLPNYQKVED
ncbi:MAG: transglycosylase domain-containing protein [Bdellovibrionales bacterium]|nr:transglycosylase domain-containing protein [Bdellovibrionales bacterium]